MSSGCEIARGKMAEFTLVATQVLVLFILISIGVGLTKKNILNKNAVAVIADIMLYVVTPCVIINSFEREMEPGLLKGLGITAIATLIVHVIGIILAHLIMRDKDDSKQRMYRFAVVFSNCGFMALPIEEAVLGSIGVFYGAIYVAIFNILVWTYGYIMMNNNTKDGIPWKKIIFNPGLIGLACGIIVFIFQIQLPDIIRLPISYISALNTPLPMMAIGFYVAQLKLKDLGENKKQYIAMALRLVIVPLLSLLVMKLIGITGDVMVVTTIAACAPIGAMVNTFAIKFNRDAKLAAQMVSVATLLSIITMPLLITLAQFMM